LTPSILFLPRADCSAGLFFSPLAGLGPVIPGRFDPRVRPLCFFQRKAVCTAETTKEQNDNDVLWLFRGGVNWGKEIRQ